MATRWSRMLAGKACAIATSAPPWLMQCSSPRHGQHPGRFGGRRRPARPSRGPTPTEPVCHGARGIQRGPSG
ncbi:hypothetical protein PF008_g4409 [Phytophthora fragariae]|uniref:Uncharacterized protein n=1 Tax=Phytophthora fragariae TaxID=53985 RepID=A0A6G0SD18_9STRA|nr:hypothetical protein PF008_g4409 [Phytophthora fragariae]